MRYIILVALLASINVAQSQTLPDTDKASMVWQYFNTKQYEGDKRLYTEDDLYPPYAVKGQASDSTIAQYLRLLRNEIYARHGRIFKDSQLQSFYGKMDWFTKNKKESGLNESEKNNIDCILKQENKNIQKPNANNNKNRFNEVISRFDEVINNRLKEVTIKSNKGSENYVMKILLKLPWGNKLHEVGYGNGEGGSPELSQNIEIEDNKIYILDPPNNRIQIFNNDGELISSIRAEDKPDSTFEKVYDENGNVIPEKSFYNYQIAADKIYIDSLHNLHIPQFNKTVKIYNIETKTTKYDYEKIKKDNTTAYNIFVSSENNENVLEKEITIKSLSDKSISKQIKINDKGPISIIGHDDKINIYLYAGSVFGGGNIYKVGLNNQIYTDISSDWRKICEPIKQWVDNENIFIFGHLPNDPQQTYVSSSSYGLILVKFIKLTR